MAMPMQRYMRVILTSTNLRLHFVRFFAAHMTKMQQHWTRSRSVRCSKSIEMSNGVEQYMYMYQDVGVVKRNS
jgi:hypothetical protein